MSRRTLLIVLFVSLAVNLFVIGVLAGGRLAGVRWWPRLQPASMHGPASAASRALAPEHRKAFREGWRAQARDTGPRLREGRALRHRAIGRFGEEPFDAPGILADLDRARALEMGARADVDRHLVEFAATLPPEDRTRFGRALLQPGRELGRRGPGEGRRLALPNR